MLISRPPSRASGKSFSTRCARSNERRCRDTVHFGDLHYRLPGLRLLVHRPVLSSVVVNYTVHEEQPLVIVQGVKLLS